MTTPGPWAVSPTKHRTLIVSAHGFHVAAIEDVSPDDAALMASAPALLAALRELVQGVRDEFSCSHPLNEAANRASAAISQAQQGHNV